MTRVICLVAAAALLITHPLVFAAIKAAPGRLCMLIIYLIFSQTLNSLIRIGDVRSMATTATWFAIAFIFDIRLTYVMLAAIPFICLAAPREIMQKHPGSFLLLLLFPTIAFILSYFYINHFVAPIPFGIMQMMQFSPQGVLPDLPVFPWHYNFAGMQWQGAALLAFCCVACFPLMAIAPLILRGEQLVVLPVFIAAVPPLFGSILATSLYYPDYPAIILMLLMVPSAMGANALIMRGREPAALVLLSLGWLGGAAMLSTHSIPFTERILSISGIAS